MTTTENYQLQATTYHSYRPRSWRLKRNGLNIEGLCTNAQCAAYNQMVVINLGIGEFDFARIILERKNKCPKCNSKVHPTKYALLRCQWRFVHHYTLQEYPLNTVHDIYKLNNLYCEYQIIETMPLPQTDRIHLSFQEVTCSICLSNIDVNNINETSHLNCSHTFHRNCINRWLKSNESMASNCPMCRVHITKKY